MRNRFARVATLKGPVLLAAAAATALCLVPTASADDPANAPTVDKSAYTTPDSPGWVYFRAYGAGGQGCGISPDGTVGCDITVARNADGTVVQWGQPGPAGFYSCNLPGQQQFYCPLPPPGTNQVVADPQNPARYVSSGTATFTRNVPVLPEGYRLVNGNAWCYVSGSSPGGITCRTGGNGFHWSAAGGTLGGLS